MKPETLFHTVHSLLWERKSRAAVKEYGGPERRQAERRNPLYFLPMHTREEWTLLGYVYDVSPVGCMLASSRMVKEGETYQVALKMPKSLGRTEGLPVTARCVWLRSDYSNDQSLSGFAFEPMNDENRKMLETVVRDYCYHGL